jgi:hypothetical protein
MALALPPGKDIFRLNLFSPGRDAQRAERERERERELHTRQFTLDSTLEHLPLVII